jgi:outer membrane protein OmpA-like peptidoglycan-associated protein
MKLATKLTVKLALVAAALASGCAVMSPDTERQLVGAREAYSRAASDPQVQRYAALELKSASEALQDAERMAQDRADATLVQHNAYLAERRARTAVTTAQVRQTEVATLEARAERRRLQAEAREREAAAARAQAQQAQAARREAEMRAQALEQERLKVVQQQTAAAELAAEVKKLEAQYPGAQVKQTPRGWVVALGNDLLFEGGTTLKPDADAALNDVAQFLRKHPERGVAIEGFSDSSAEKDAAERMSERRAQAVKFALVQRGVEPHRIDARGYGGAFPVGSNDTELGRRQNRRIEIVISPS